MLIASSLSFGCDRPPDVPICTEITPNKGFCTHTLSDTEYFVDNSKQLFTDIEGKKLTWNELKTVSLIVPARESYSPIIAYMITQCRKVPGCTAAAPTAVKMERRLMKKLMQHEL